MNEYDDIDGGSSPDEYMENDIDDEDTIDEAQDLREQLGDIPLGEIKKLKDKVGLKKYNEVLFGASQKQELESEEPRRKDNKKYGTIKTKNVYELKKKSKKSEPLEVSSKIKKFSKPRMVVKNDKRSTRDPRFSDLSGEFNEDLFKKSYSFINGIKQDEYEMVKKQLKKIKNPEQKSDLLRLKQKLDDEQKLETEKMKRREVKKQRQASMKEDSTSGKKPYYLKKSDQKKIELAEKYRELKSTGKLEKFLMKKRKRNAQKDRKSLPQLKTK